MKLGAKSMGGQEGRSEQCILEGLVTNDAEKVRMDRQ